MSAHDDTFWDYRLEIIKSTDPNFMPLFQAVAGNHPGWSNEQVAERVNSEYADPVVSKKTVARLRAEVVQ